MNLEKELYKKTPYCGEWMRIVMVINNVTIDELANRMHITRQTISDYYKNKRAVPFSMICTFVYALKIEIDPEEVWKHFYQKKD